MRTLDQELDLINHAIQNSVEPIEHFNLASLGSAPIVLVDIKSNLSADRDLKEYRKCSVCRTIMDTILSMAVVDIKTGKLYPLYIPNEYLDIPLLDRIRHHITNAGSHHIEVLTPNNANKLLGTYRKIITKASGKHKHIDVAKVLGRNIHLWYRRDPTSIGLIPRYLKRVQSTLEYLSEIKIDGNLRVAESISLLEPYRDAFLAEDLTRLGIVKEVVASSILSDKAKADAYWLVARIQKLGYDLAVMELDRAEGLMRGRGGYGHIPPAVPLNGHDELSKYLCTPYKDVVWEEFACPYEYSGISSGVDSAEPTEISIDDFTTKVVDWMSVGSLVSGKYYTGNNTNVLVRVPVIYENHPDALSTSIYTMLDTNSVGVFGFVPGSEVNTPGFMLEDVFVDPPQRIWCGDFKELGDDEQAILDINKVLGTRTINGLVRGHHYQIPTEVILPISVGGLFVLMVHDGNDSVTPHHFKIV